MLLFVDKTTELLARLTTDEVEKLWIRCRANEGNDINVRQIFFYHLKFHSKIPPQAIMII